MMAQMAGLRNAFLSRGRAVAAALLVLAACSSGPPPVEPGLATPRALDPAKYRAPGIPSRFGDVSPTAWGHPAPDSHAVHGIDASRWQGEIDFHKARAAGVSFAWLKATEGGDRADPGYKRNAAAARAAGVPVGAYHFYYFCRSAREQAQWFIANVPREKGDLPPVLDMEWNHLSPSCKLRPPAETVRAEIVTYAQAIERHYGTRPVIYVTPDFYADNALGQLSGYEFWLRSVAAHPSERYPGESWSFWQYTGTGVVPGVGGKVDLNAFSGSHRNWQGWLEARQQR